MIQQEHHSTRTETADTVEVELAAEVDKVAYLHSMVVVVEKITTLKPSREHITIIVTKSYLKQMEKHSQTLHVSNVSLKGITNINVHTQRGQELYQCMLDTRLHKEVCLIFPKFGCFSILVQHVMYRITQNW